MGTKRAMKDKQNTRKGMRVLVTGGAGFIGSNIVKLLLEESYRVSILDNFSTGYLENLTDFTEVTVINGDIRDEAAVATAIEGVAAIIHLAASVGNARSLNDPVLDSDVNILGTLKILEAARKASITKVIYSSSAAIYGEPQYLPVDEGHPLRPETPYGVSKLGGEGQCLAYGRLYSMDTICLRYFNVYGPNQHYDAYGNVIPIFADQLLQRKPITILGSGEQTRDFVNVRDVARANLFALNVNGVTRAFNIGSGQATTIQDLASEMSSFFEISIPIRHHSPRAGDVQHSLSDITAAREILGYEPTVPLTDGLNEYLTLARPRNTQQRHEG
jgi:UDP-glucose 4-epimerase